MRIVLFFLAAAVLNAYSVKITSVSGSSAVVDKYVKKGVSGLVICPYGDRKIICARAILEGKKAFFYPYESLKNDAFALPTVYPKKGDEIILAKNYDRILIIAPDQQTYLKVKALYKNSVVISPDNFALYVDELPLKKDFVKFAKEYDVGKIVFVLDKLYEVDALSFYVIKKSLRYNVIYKKPFFTTLDIYNEKVNMIDYYKSMLKD